MRVTVLLLALASVLVFAAGNAVTAPRTAANLQSTICNLESPEVITIPQMLSYQGKLTDTLGQPVPDNDYSVAFKLYTLPTGGSPFWNETQDVKTRAGLFSVLLGSVTPIGSVPGAGALYLGMAVGGGAELTPRVRIVSTAYAYKADTANYALAAAGADSTWVRGGDSVLYTVHELGLARGGASNALLGNYPESHLNLGVQCTTGTVGGSQFYCTVLGYKNVTSGNGSASIAGGQYNRSAGFASFVGGGFYNRVSGRAGAIGAGIGDTVLAECGAVLGGSGNVAGDAADDTAATVAGGSDNRANAKYAFVGGGIGNDASFGYTVIAGGWLNSATLELATVGGGYANLASNYYATVPGGWRDTAAGQMSFATNGNSIVPASYDNAAAFNGQTVTASNQTRVGVLSKASGSFTIDHPLDPHGKILNHYFIEGPEMRNIYDGEAVLDASGRAVVTLPDYFDALNRAPRVQLTGVGNSDVYVAQEEADNRFVIGGRPGTKVYWQVTGERKDVSAEATRRMMPVEQLKTGPLAGRMLDDDFLVGCMDQLVREGKAQGIDFRTAAGRAKYEGMKQNLRETGR
jgi:hypothetical protein